MNSSSASTRASHYLDVSDGEDPNRPVYHEKPTGLASPVSNDDPEPETEVGGGGPPPKHSLFEPAFKSERKWMAKTTVLTILAMFVGILALLPIYWGSFYQRESRMHNLTAVVYNQDEGDDRNSLGPLVGDALVKSLIPNAMGWEVRNNSVSIKDVQDEVHEEHAWVGIYIPKNATRSLYSALASADVQFNKSDIITVVYERERDLTTISSYLPVLTQVEKIFQTQGGGSIYAQMMKQLSTTERDNLMTRAPQLLTNPIQFKQVDLSTYKPAILIAVLQVGLIYLIIIAFFQFNFFTPLHMRVGPKLNPQGNMIYRLIISLLSYFFVSLSIALVSLAFQIDMTLTYGKGGFVVFWMTLFLTMVACGQAIENLALLAIAVWAPLIGFILLFFVIVQISPSFSALELCPQFYHYGWIFPVFNAAQILRVVLVGTTAKNMGKNYGIIVAWIVADYLFFPICMMVFGKAMAKQAMRAKK